MSAPRRRVRSTADARVAVLAARLDQLRVPVHVRHSNARLRELLAADVLDEPDPAVLVRAILWRKDRCPRCAGDPDAQHAEQDDTRVDEFTPGVAPVGYAGGRSQEVPAPSRRRYPGPPTS